MTDIRDEQLAAYIELLLDLARKADAGSRPRVYDRIECSIAVRSASKKAHRNRRVWPPLLTRGTP